jgi:hypothetical protein
MKSHAKLISLCSCFFKDAAAQCATAEVDTNRDLMRIKKRVKSEGLSFLTITLPNFGQGFESSLENRKVTHTEFQGWKFSKCLPVFLRGFTSLVFDVATGDLLESP